VVLIADYEIFIFPYLYQFSGLLSTVIEFENKVRSDFNSPTSKPSVLGYAQVVSELIVHFYLPKIDFSSLIMRSIGLSKQYHSTLFSRGAIHFFI
jgi:hypothetical protein